MSALQRLIAFGLVAAGSLSLLCVGAGSPAASAATNGQYSIFPATVQQGNPRVLFNYLANPGSVITDAVAVTNQTTQSIAFNLYSTDAVNGQQGGYVFNPQNKPAHTVGTWTQLSSLGFNLPPHSLANVPFTLKIPAGQTPGDYAGGIVLVPVNPAVEHRGAVTFNLFQAVGARIYVRVRGPLHPGLSITQLSIGTSGIAGLVGGPVSSTVTYRLTNTGNQILNPTAKLSVSPLLGSATTVPPRIFPSLLPHNSVTLTYKFPSKEAFLRFTANLSVKSGGGTTTASATAWVIPWILIAILVIFIALFWYWRRRRRHAADGIGAGAVEDEAVVAATSGV
jgi:hypothetical protein